MVPSAQESSFSQAPSPPANPVEKLRAALAANPKKAMAALALGGVALTATAAMAFTPDIQASVHAPLQHLVLVGTDAVSHLIGTVHAHLSHVATQIHGGVLSDHVQQVKTHAQNLGDAWGRAVNHVTRFAASSPADHIKAGSNHPTLVEHASKLTKHFGKFKEHLAGFHTKVQALAQHPAISTAGEHVKTLMTHAVKGAHHIHSVGQGVVGHVCHTVCAPNLDTLTRAYAEQIQNNVVTGPYSDQPNGFREAAIEAVKNMGLPKDVAMNMIHNFKDLTKPIMDQSIGDPNGAMAPLGQAVHNLVEKAAKAAMSGHTIDYAKTALTRAAM